MAVSRGKEPSSTKPAPPTPDPARTSWRNAQGQLVGKVNPFQRLGDNLRRLFGGGNQSTPAGPKPSDISTQPLKDLPGKKLPGIQQAGEQEIREGKAAVAETEADIAARESRSEGDISRGMQSAYRAKEATLGVAEAGQETTDKLPERVAADVDKRVTEANQRADIDVGRIESIGREAASAAMEGKNAASQAAVAAQQNSTRTAIAQINADPNIPQSRKTAMIANINSQSSMAIAATVGANIKDFTAMQVGALTSTMQSVGAALQTKTQVTGQLAATGIQAIASAHEAAANLHKGYDDMKAGAIANAEQTKYNYNTLRTTMRQNNNQVSLALLGEKARVSALPLDFKMLDYQLTSDAIKNSLALDFQGKGLSIMEQQVVQSQKDAGLQMMMGILGAFMPG